MQLELISQDFAQRAVSPFLELGAYESLWDEQSASFKSIADLFSKQAGAVPSDFVERSRASSYANDVHARLKDAGIRSYGVRVHGGNRRASSIDQPGACETLQQSEEPDV